MSVSFSPLRNASMRERAAYEIERKIFSGELKEGDRLLPERDLAAAMGVSRSLVNLAVLDLAAKGFLRIIPRQGTIVADYRVESTPQMLLSLIIHGSDNVSRDIFAGMMETRRLIEGECVRLAAENGSAGDAETFRHIFDEMENASSLDDFVDANFRFHHRICLASGNIVYAMIFKSFEQALRYYLGRLFGEGEDRGVSVEQHRALVEAIASRDPAAAQKALGIIMDEGIGGLMKLRGK